MHIISRKRLLEAGILHSDLIDPLDMWFRIAKKAAWKNLTELRQQMPATDGVGKYTVFNIKGNAYRLIAEVFYDSQVILVRSILTHAEYSKEGWK